MRQSLLDKIGVDPCAENLGEVYNLRAALKNLPESTFPDGLDFSLHPSVQLLDEKIVRLHNTYGGTGKISVRFPRKAANCSVNGSVCTFEYKGREYQIN